MRIMSDALVHDQSHLEIALSYPVSPKDKLIHQYKTDFYFFVPKVMGITSNSYSKDRFYSDITNYLRVHTPYTTGNELVILNQIVTCIDNCLNPEPSTRNSPSVYQTIKLFGNTLNKRLKEDIHDSDKLIELLHVVSRFRSGCVKRVQKPTLLIPSELRKTILLVDEYLSNRIETVLVDIKTPAVKGLLEQELAYRQSQQEHFFIKRTTDAEKEYFFHRQGLLKKVVAVPLFLEVKKKNLDSQYRNFIASFGAALAALWAQFAEHHTYQATNASDFGFQFIAVAFIAVGIYVFKDRIKDLSKEYVSEKLKGRIPDIKSVFNRQDLGLSGSITEYIRYAEEKTISPEIRFLRRLKGRWDVEAPYPDTVLHYHRTVNLKNEPRALSDIWVNAVKDILRFNFSFFLTHLDDPIKEYFAYDLEDGVTKVTFPKVYHLNVVIRTSTELLTEYSGYRLIFNRTGIIRIESLSEGQDLSLTEGLA